jgi:hypothetical protein
MDLDWTPFRGVIGDLQSDVIVWESGGRERAPIIGGSGDTYSRSAASYCDDAGGSRKQQCDDTSGVVRGELLAVGRDALVSGLDLSRSAADVAGDSRGSVGVIPDGYAERVAGWRSWCKRERFVWLVSTVPLVAVSVGSWEAAQTVPLASLGSVVGHFLAVYLALGRAAATWREFEV